MVSVQFGQAGTAPVPEEGEYLVFRIPDSGVLKTATPEPEYGKAADKYYYVDQKGTRTEIEPTVGIHGGSIGGKEGAPPTLSFFVGSQAEWEKFKQQQTNK
ncbi:hypothetical protein CBW65_18120 [Tumebacillus avium]|uniref:DUF6843 domain-containing protein n=2 Tax=Tumebacillus avium TaxID=1903704 RepID=A0A1Y0IQ20_9BACL|nr:hypothetical protein CBW65_18120 [Tumebacillus avium]